MGRSALLVPCMNLQICCKLNVMFLPVWHINHVCMYNGFAILSFSYIYNLSIFCMSVKAFETNAFTTKGLKFKVECTTFVMVMVMGDICPHSGFPTPCWDLQHVY